MSVLAFFIIFQCNHFAKNAEKRGRSLPIARLAEYNCGIVIKCQIADSGSWDIVGHCCLRLTL